METDWQAAIDALRAAGYVVIAWTPEEIGEKDPSTLEDMATQRGNLFLEG